MATAGQHVESRDGITFVSAARTLAFGYPRAVRAIETALRHGLDPSADPPRTSTPVGEGATLLYMPSVSSTHAGVKVITHKPSNAGTGHPLVHGLYVLFDRATLGPTALLDGAALTTLRTPAVSMAAVRPWLRRFQRPVNLVVFGLGPQGVGHFDAFCDLAAADGDIAAPARATFVLRGDLDDPRLPRCDDVEVVAVRAGSDEATKVLKDADVVVCATTARVPLFDSSVLADSSVTIAVGSHSPDAAEVDTGLCARALVVVEDVATALRECGEIVRAVSAGAVAPENLVGIQRAPSWPGGRNHAAKPVLFKGAGMAWEDLVVAEAIVEAVRATSSVGCEST